MKIPRARTWIILASLAAVGLASWWWGWFVGEPVYHGRTVTSWLDHTVIFEDERIMDDSGESSYRSESSPSRLAQDLKPFTAMGSNAVPVLVKRLIEGPQWQLKVGPIGRLTAWSQWKWKTLTGSKPTPFPPVLTSPSSFQSARQDAAALALLALGTNANAGLPCLLQALTDSPHHLGGSRSFSPYLSLFIAKSLPDRRAEIIFGINSALQHTNSEIRGLMADATRLFLDQLPLWKNRLLEMTKDQDERVRIWTLRALAMTASSDTNVLNLLEAVLKEPSLSERERGYAAGDMGFCGIKATNSLPLLRKTASGTNSFLRSSAHSAVQMIEKAVHDDKTALAK